MPGCETVSPCSATFIVILSLGAFDVIMLFVVQAQCERPSYFLGSGWLSVAILEVTNQTSMG